MPLKKWTEQLSGGLQPVYLVTGSAGPLVTDAVAAVREQALPEVGVPAFNVDVIRSGEPDPERALSSARTPPMMGARRLVILMDIDEGSDTLLQAVIDYLDAPSDTTTLVLTGPRMPKQEKGRPAWGRKLKGAVPRECQLALDDKAISPEAFAVQRAARTNKVLTRSAAKLLVEIAGKDLGRIGLEVDKAATYVGAAGEIDDAAVEAVTSMLAEAVIWDLTTGLATRNADLALSSLHRLTVEGEDPRRLLGMITWQIRQIIVMAEMASKGASDDEIRRSSRMRWDTFKRVRPMLGKGMPDAATLLGALSGAHRQMNSHRAGAERILDRLVLQLLDPSVA